jgi:hypothetical protein
MRKSRQKCCSLEPTFITGLQVILDRAGKRFVDPPLLSDDVALQTSQDGTYLRSQVNTRPCGIILLTEAQV